MANCLLAEAADRYRAAFAFPEFDPAFYDRVIILGGPSRWLSSYDQGWTVAIVVVGEKRQLGRKL